MCDLSKVVNDLYKSLDFYTDIDLFAGWLYSRNIESIYNLYLALEEDPRYKPVVTGKNLSELHLTISFQKPWLFSAYSPHSNFPVAIFCSGTEIKFLDRTYNEKIVTNIIAGIKDQDDGVMWASDDGVYKSSIPE